VVITKLYGAKVTALAIDTSHWKTNGYNKGKQLKAYNQYIRSTHLKKHLIIERGHSCELCNHTMWLDAPIVLELHHIDGNHANNNKDNLQLLCPNCHSTTPNWRNRRR